jgi:putative heme-binding domain-containing protein
MIIWTRELRTRELKNNMSMKLTTMKTNFFEAFFISKKQAMVWAVMISVFVSFSCNNAKDEQSSSKGSANSKTENLKLPSGFHAEHLYTPSNNEQGSWVTMTFDDKGRMIACDQYGYLYRLTMPPVGYDTTKAKVQVEKLDVKIQGDTSRFKIGYAHGLLYAFNSLYVMVNDEGDTTLKRRSGLYRLQDTNHDDQYDKITLLKRLKGFGEHGPHSPVLSPDKKSIYVIAGNFTDIPKMDSYRRGSPDWQIDNLLPLIRDPNGHDNTVGNHGGWIAKMDSSGNNWELISSGFRNPFDLTFNQDGEMFAYDSDMEWDFGLPWYRPTRICHVTSGSEFGWRPGTEKWSPAYPDNVPPVLNVGQGSPTSFFAGRNAHFPEKYRKALFAFDWSFGIIYALNLDGEGASYKAKGEEFISGSPLPLTDGVIGPDGAMYFLTGGRKLDSDLYRVYYGDNTENTEKLADTEPNDQVKIRRKLEEYHGKPQRGAVDFAWQYLNNKDRFIRYAARVAIENQPVSEWQNRVHTEKDPVILTQAGIALARKGNATVKSQLLKSLMTINYSQLSEAQQLDLARAFELVFSRMGRPGAAEKASVAAYLNPQYPAKTNELNRELSKVLVYIEAPQSVEKTLALMAAAKDDNSNQSTLTQSSDLILRNPQYGLDIANMLSKVPPSQQTYYATVLSQAKTGWTPQLQEKYFKWFSNAFKFKGGHSFIGFVNLARKNALANVSKDRFAYYNTISGDTLVGRSGIYLAEGTLQPVGPGRRWTMEEAVAVADSGITNRNFESGKAMFSASLCKSCHTMRGEGGVAGPDLTQLGTRFSYNDILEAIIEPSKEVPDQYAATTFYLKEGGSVVGRMISQDNEKYTISQNPFTPEQVREILKKDVARTKLSEVSPMLPGLINRLNSEELRDLLAYLKSGGNKDDKIFSNNSNKKTVASK